MRVLASAVDDSSTALAIRTYQDPGICSLPLDIHRYCQVVDVSSRRPVLQ